MKLGSRQLDEQRSLKFRFLIVKVPTGKRPRAFSAGHCETVDSSRGGDRDQRPDNLGFPARAAARTWRRVRGLVDITDISRCSVGGEPCLRVLSLSTSAGLLPPSLQILRPQSRTNGSDSSGCFQNILLWKIKSLHLDIYTCLKTEDLFITRIGR